MFRFYPFDKEYWKTIIQKNWWIVWCIIRFLIKPIAIQLITKCNIYESISTISIVQENWKKSSRTTKTCRRTVPQKSTSFKSAVIVVITKSQQSIRSLPKKIFSAQNEKKQFLSEFRKLIYLFNLFFKCEIVFVWAYNKSTRLFI